MTTPDRSYEDYIMSDQKKLLTMKQSLEMSTGVDLKLNPFKFKRLSSRVDKNSRNKECDSWNVDIIFKNMIDSFRKERTNVRENKTKTFKTFKDVTKMHLDKTVNINEINSRIDYPTSTIKTTNTTNINPKYCSTENPYFLNKKKKATDELLIPNIKAFNYNIHLDIKNINIKYQEMNKYQEVRNILDRIFKV